MKPWPEEILKAYPLPPFEAKEIPGIGKSSGQYARRPWWDWFCLSSEALLNGEKAKSAMDMRFGWRRRDGRFLFVSKVNAMGMMFNPEEQKKLEPSHMEALEAVDQEHPLPHPGLRLGQIWGNLSGNAFLISSLPSVSTFDYDRLLHECVYLIHDPACPWLAPWTLKEGA